MLGHLEAERDSVVSQLIEAREHYDFEIARLNSELLALEKELEQVGEEMSTSRKRYQELS